MVSSFLEYYNLLDDNGKFRILYVLDYILNYRKGWRYLFRTEELGLGDEVKNLAEISVIQKRSETDPGGNKYDVLAVALNLEDEIRKIITTDLLPKFTKPATTDSLTRIVNQNFKASIRLYDKLMESKESLIVTLFQDQSTPEIDSLSRELVGAGLVYVVGHKSSTWQTYYGELFFRELPLEVKNYFVDVVERQIRERLGKLTEVEKWCVYLRTIRPDANDPSFFLDNRNSFTRDEIEKTLVNLQELRSIAKGDLSETIISETKERLSLVLRNFMLRDVKFLTTLSLIFTLGEEQNGSYRFINLSLEKLRDISYEGYNVVNEYLGDLRHEGIVLKDYDTLIVPAIIKDIFVGETRGNILEVKWFENRLGFETFLYDLLGRARLGVKIWDPYFSPTVFDLIEKGVNPGTQGVSVNILTSKTEGYPSIMENSVKRRIEDLRKSRVDIKIKAIFKPSHHGVESPYHDRYLVVDDKEVWMTGSSLHSIGNKREAALQLRREHGSLVIGAFENYWNKSSLAGWQVFMV